MEINWPEGHAAMHVLDERVKPYSHAVQVVREVQVEHSEGQSIHIFEVEVTDGKVLGRQFSLHSPLYK